MTTDLFAWRDQYPNSPGFKRTETAKAAAESMKPTAATLRSACMAMLLAVRDLTRGGLTADETAEELGESVLSIRPRFSELSALNLIVDSGERRLNASGRRAVVWKAV